MKQTVSIIGAGRVATHIALRLQEKGVEIKGIFSRSQARAERLARRCHIPQAVSEVTSLARADVLIFSVTDDALPVLAAKLTGEQRESLLVHTAGSVPLSVLYPEGDSNLRETEAHLDKNACRKTHFRGAVLYPMQTFSEQRTVDWDAVTCFVEGSCSEALSEVEELARALTRHVCRLDSNGRATLHLAATVACNFTNHCYHIAHELLRRAGTDGRCLLPLMQETVSKLAELSPNDAQTGPALRGDSSVTQQHLWRLAHLSQGEKEKELWASLYRLMSEDIRRMCLRQGETESMTARYR